MPAPKRPTTAKKIRFPRVRAITKRVWNSKLGRWVLIGATAGALAVGGHRVYTSYRVPRNGKPPVVRVAPLQERELKEFSLRQVSHESLELLIGGRQRQIVNERLRKDIARQWWEAFAPTSNANDRLPRLPEMRAHTLIALSDAAMRFNDASPRKVAGYIQSVPRLFNLAKTMYANSVARARAFYDDPALLRAVGRNPGDRDAIQFFRELSKVQANGWLSGREAIRDIYAQLGLE